MILHQRCCCFIIAKADVRSYNQNIYARVERIIFKKDRWSCLMLPMVHNVDRGFLFGYLDFYISTKCSTKFPAGYVTTSRPLWHIYGLVVPYLWLLFFRFYLFIFRRKTEPLAKERLNRSIDMSKNNYITTHPANPMTCRVRIEIIL